ncbi:MAG: hypothetical protein U9O82_00075 [Thermodesulfobacteriota bacterium]|nr:hypothetical protein [Thermodesulfobacteriota bacterium]
MIINNRFPISALLLSAALLPAMLPGCSSLSGKARDHAGDINQARKISGFYDTSRKYQITLEKEKDAPALISAEADREIKGLRPDEKQSRQVEEIRPLEERKSAPFSQAGPAGEKFPVSIQLEDVSIKDLLDTILVDFLEASYVINARPAKKVSINLHGSFSGEDMLTTLRATLEVMNLTLVNHNGVYHVMPSKIVHSLAGGMQFVVRSPQHVRVENLLAVLKDLNSGGGKLSTIQGTNILLVFDYPENIRRILSIIEVFDVPFFSNRHVRIYTLKIADAKDVAEELKKLLNEYGLFVIKDPTHARIVPIERLNKVVTIASSQATLDFLAEWIEVLDQKKTTPDRDMIFIYEPAYCLASDLVNLLKNVFPKFDKDSENGLSANYDDTSNLLVIKSEKSTYYKAREIIASMDKPPAQVYIQAVIAEIRLDEDMSMGFQWFFKHKFGSGLEHLGNLEMGSIMGNNATNAFRVALTATDFYGFLNLMAQNQDAKIIATPHILVRDGEEASIEIKTEVPVIKSFLTTDVTQGGDTANQPSIEYKDAGIILKVHPRIISRDELEIKVDQEVSDPKEVTILGDLQSYEFSTRIVSTQLLLKDQESIMIGGLIKEGSQDTRTSIPYLDKIPLLKYLFKANESKMTRTELVLFLTPVIINDPNQLEEFTGRLAALFSSAAQPKSPKWDGLK